MVTWVSGHDSPQTTYNTFGQYYDERGAAVGGEFLVSDDGRTFGPEIAALAGGWFVLATDNEPHRFPSFLTSSATVFQLEQPPEVALADQTVAANEWIALTDIAGISDPNGDAPTRYQVWDSGTYADSGYFWLMGLGWQPTDTLVTFTDLDEANTRGGTDSGTETLWLRADDDNGFGEWGRFTLGTNGAPEVTVEELPVDPNEEISLARSLTLTQSDADPIVKYELWDNEGTENNWLVNGVAVDASLGYEDADLDAISIRGDAAAGTQPLWVRANDGTSWSAWDSFDFVTGTGAARPGPQSPDVAIDDQVVRPDKWVRLSTIASVSDPNGDAITQYQFWDGEAAADSGYYWLPGLGQQAAETLVTFTNLGNAWIRGGTDAGTETMWLRAHDGAESGEWGRFHLGTNPAPEVSVEDQTLDRGEAVDLDQLLVVTQDDADAIVKYELWDDEGIDNNWLVDGDAVDATIGYEVTDIGSVSFKGDLAVGTQTLWVRANDGLSWGEWFAFDLTTTNTAPTASIDDQSALPNATIQLQDVLTVTDADGDAITRYQLWDDDGPDSWVVDGIPVDASSGAFVNDLSSVMMQADRGPRSETMWARAFDGEEWSEFDSFELTTLPDAHPDAPTVSISDHIETTTFRWLHLSRFARTNDPNGDPIVSYEIWDDEGDNNWWFDGDFVDASSGYVVNDPTGVWLRSDVKEFQELYVRVNDGTHWSDWEGFTFETMYNFEI